MALHRSWAEDQGRSNGPIAHALGQEAQDTALGGGDPHQTSVGIIEPRGRGRGEHGRQGDSRPNVPRCRHGEGFGSMAASWP